MRVLYTFYMKNYLGPTENPGSPITTETRLYSVPISQADGDNLAPLTDPTVKNECGKTGAFEFSIAPRHPLYNALMQMKTIMRLEYDETTLFRGRVLTIDSSPLTGVKKVHLEGDLAFLMDSYQPGVKEENRPEVAVLSYIQTLLQNHNAQMDEEGSADKKVYVGEVPGQYSNSINDVQKVVVNGTHKFGSNSWGTTMSALEALAKEYGGFFRTRWDNQQGKCYLDWLDNCFQYETNSQPIEIGENLIDISGSSEVDNIFTALVPIGRSHDEDIYVEGYREDIHGHNKRILVPQILSVFSDAELNHGIHSKSDYQNAVRDYGIIYKTQSFPNADTQEKLWNYATDWIKNNYVGGITGFDITALDMHHVDGEAEQYFVGDRVTVIYPDMGHHTAGNTPLIQKVLTILSAQYYPHNPEKNHYSISMPNLLLSKTYGTTNKSKGGSGIGGNNRDDEERRKEIQKRIQEMSALAWRYVANARYNNDIYDQLTAEDPKKGNAALKSTYIMVQEGLNANEDSPTSGTHKKRLQKMWIDGVNNSFEMAGPVDPAIILTDEQKDQLNQVNRVISFNAIKQEFGMRQALDITTGNIPSKPPENMMLAKVGLIRSSSGVQPAIQGSVELWDTYKQRFSSAGAPTSLFGNGTINNLTQNFGKGTPGTSPGDEPTIKVDGTEVLMNMFDPTTVGLPGVTPDKTLENEGKTGSVGAGKGGDLNGWKITLNKPLTYKAMIDGAQKTFTVDPGMVAADDMHFTKKYDSVYAELAVFDQMYADYAQIGTLVAMKATIDEIESKYVSTEYLNAGFTISGGITASSITASGTIDARGAISASDFKFRSNAASLGKGIKTLASSSDSSGNITLTPTLLDGTTGTPVTFSIAATLSGAYGGDNRGAVATYTVTGSPSKNFPSGNTSLGTLTLKINKNAAWVEDPTGAIRARVDNTYAGDTDAAYKRGWNECIDSCSGGYYLDDYETYMNGTKVALYVAPTGGAQKATGEDQVWRYGGSRAYRYTIPAKK